MRTRMFTAFAAFLVSACSAGTGDHVPSGVLTQINPSDVRQIQEAGSLRLSYENDSYLLLAMPSISKEGFITAAAKTLGASFDKPRPGTPVAAECVMGPQYSFVTDITSFGGDHLAGYSSFQCFAAGNAASWSVYVPAGSQEQISSGLTALGGEAAVRGVFGRRGTFYVLGHVVDQNGLLTSAANAPAVAIQAEYWFPTGRANDLESAAKDMTAGGAWALETAAQLRGIGVQ